MGDRERSSWETDRYGPFDPATQAWPGFRSTCVLLRFSLSLRLRLSVSLSLSLILAQDVVAFVWVFSCCLCTLSSSPLDFLQVPFSASAVGVLLLSAVLSILWFSGFFHPLF